MPAIGLLISVNHPRGFSEPKTGVPLRIEQASRSIEAGTLAESVYLATAMGCGRPSSS
jgi:hypothetical protein